MSLTFLVGAWKPYKVAMPGIRKHSKTDARPKVHECVLHGYRAAASEVIIAAVLQIT